MRLQCFERPFHPGLFGLFPLLFFLSVNQYVLNASLSSLLITSVLTGIALLSLALVKGLTFWTRNTGKSALLVSLLWILFLAAGHVFDFFSLIVSKQIQAWALPIFLLFWTITGSWLAWQILRLKSCTTLTLFLNAMGFCLVGWSLFNLSGAFWMRLPNPKPLAPVEILSKTIPRPDVYYIILDGHARSDVLQRLYDDDNHEFIDGLKQLGFYVASDSRSNYTTTFHSLASSLNAQYLDTSNAMQFSPQNRHPYYHWIHQSRVIKQFQKYGYQTINLNSDWAATSQIRSADENLMCSFWDASKTTFLKTTFVGVLFNDFLVARQPLKHRQCELENLKTTLNRPGPKFVIAHFLAPHPPFVFDTHGPNLHPSHKNLSDWTNRNGYLEQMIYLDQQILAFVKILLQQTSGQKPVIIVQADHGPASLLEAKNGVGWQHPTTEMIDERTGILNAYYFPSSYHAALYPTITPVNTFPMVWNTLFKARQKLLPDRTYFSVYQPNVHFFQEIPKSLRQTYDTLKRKKAS